MKKRAVCIILGVLLTGTMFTGCGKNKATEAASESAQTEKEGAGEDVETDTETNKKSDQDSSDKETSSDKDSSVKEETARYIGADRGGRAGGRNRRIRR